MFLGHFAVAMAAKKITPKTSLGTLAAASQLLDLIWPPLLLLGIEQVAIAPELTPVAPLDFLHYPYSHSLAFVLLWSAIAGYGYARWKRNAKAGWVVGGLVLSHWLLDAISHRPDVPLLPSGPFVGAGLWYSLPATLAVEFGLFAAGLAIYVRATRPVPRRARWGLPALCAVLVAIYLASVFGPPPPSVPALGATALLGGIGFLWAFHRVDAGRAVTAGSGSGGPGRRSRGRTAAAGR